MERPTKTSAPSRVPVHPFAAPFVENPSAIGHQDVLGGHPQVLIELHACDGRRTRTRDHHANIFDFLVRDLERIQQRGGGNDRSAVLVIVKNWNVESPFESFLDLKAFRRTNILEIDPTKRRRDQLAGANHVVWIHTVDLDIENIDIGKALEEYALALHHGFARQGADISQSKNRSPVADHGNQIALRRIFIGGVGIALDFEARRRNARRVGEGQVLGGHRWLGGNDLELSRSTLAVVGESLVLQTHWKFLVRAPVMLFESHFVPGRQGRLGSRVARFYQITRGLV
jgi:hypothetical protein